MCVPCDCLLEGSLTPTCDKLTGDCVCKEKVSGRKCDRCPGVWQELRSKCNGELFSFINFFKKILISKSVFMLLLFLTTLKNLN